MNIWEKNIDKLENLKINTTLKNPRDMQIEFLKKVYQGLNKDGQLLLAIENKFNYAYLLGRPDPHVNLKFTTFLPRFMSNIICKIFKKKNIEPTFILFLS